VRAQRVLELATADVADALDGAPAARALRHRGHRGDRADDELHVGVVRGDVAGDLSDHAFGNDHRRARPHSVRGPPRDAQDVAVRRGADGDHLGDQVARRALAIRVLEQPLETLVLRLQLAEGAALAAVAEHVAAETQVLLAHLPQGDVAVPDVLDAGDGHYDCLLDGRGERQNDAVERVQADRLARLRRENDKWKREQEGDVDRLAVASNEGAHGYP